VRLELTYTIADAAAQQAHRDRAHAQLRGWVERSSPAVKQKRA
jgi:hypothetical protein